MACPNFLIQLKKVQIHVFSAYSEERSAAESAGTHGCAAPFRNRVENAAGVIQFNRLCDRG
jgi:hypothetical protein